MADTNPDDTELEAGEGAADADDDAAPSDARTLAQAREETAAKKRSLREKHVAQLEKALLRDDGDKPPEQKDDEDDDKPAKGRDAKGKFTAADKPGEKPKGKSDAKPQKPEDKPRAKIVAGSKQEPPKGAAKGGAKPEDEQDDEDSDKKTPPPPSNEKRQFSAFRARETRKLQEREQRVTGRERRAEQLEGRANAEIEVYRKDPVGWLKGRGVDVKQVLLDYAKQDGEDPKEKLLREAREKAERAEKRLDERDQQDKAAREKREQDEARAELREEISADWESVRDTDDYPYLSTLYEPEQAIELALETKIEHYRRHKRELSPGECFARLEHALRLDDDARQKARKRSQGEADDAGASRSPERVRSVKSENPEANERRPTHDVTNRSTRVATRDDPVGPTNGEKPRYDRARLIAMARDAMTS